jgi:hypothetical protein
LVGVQEKRYPPAAGGYGLTVEEEAGTSNKKEEEEDERRRGETERITERKSRKRESDRFRVVCAS